MGFENQLQQFTLVAAITEKFKEGAPLKEFTSTVFSTFHDYFFVSIT